ncbi:ynein regulatory complex subunit 5 [Anaeramoeba flamelloides]|uniref:Ynein regulatory complex subunit 5 n=1 Tax=Anaeramoeba flamelloides TaxID=1746091 RepID=A0ABQ8YSZ4_9EUKA|nr:ynein regulatory complex subunit 5 [Anaeramoeba flamelloides]
MESKQNKTDQSSEDELLSLPLYFDNLINNSTYLTSLKMSYKLRPIELSLLGYVLETNKTLETLSLHRIPIDKLSLELLCTGLMKNTTLKKLELIEIDFPAEPITFFEQILGSNGPPLRGLTLSGSIFPATMAKSLFEGLCMNKSVEILGLDLIDLPVDDFSFEELLRRNVNIEVVYLALKSKIGVCLPSLLKGIQFHPKLKKLYLRSLHLKPYLVKTLLQSLKELVNLQILDLSYNYSYMNQESTIKVFELLPHLPKLTRLKLNHLRVNDRTIQSLKEAIVNNQNLQSLEVRGNQLTTEGLSTLIQYLVMGSANGLQLKKLSLGCPSLTLNDDFQKLLANTSSLTLLDLSGTSFNVKSNSAILFGSLKYSNSLTTLDLSDCFWSNDSINDFCQIIEENNYLINKLILRNLYVKIKQLSVLFSSISKSYTINYVDLTGTFLNCLKQLDLTEVKKLFNEMKNCNNLETLLIGPNWFNKEIQIFLWEANNSLQNIKFIDFYSDRQDTDIINPFCKFLRNHPNLNRLILSKNGWSPEEISEICDALADHSSFLTIEMRGTYRLNSASAQLINKLMKKNFKIIWYYKLTLNRIGRQLYLQAQGYRQVNQIRKSDLINDFHQFFLMNEFTDCTINHFNAHKIWLQFRTKKDLSFITKKMNSLKISNDDLHTWLVWVYTSIILNKSMINLINNYLQIVFDWSLLKKDLIQFYNDENSKDFFILVNKNKKIDKIQMQPKKDKCLYLVNSKCNRVKEIKSCNKNGKNKEKKKKSENENENDNKNDNKNENENENENKNKNEKDKDKDQNFEKISVHKFILLVRTGVFRNLFRTLEKNCKQIKDYTQKSCRTLQIFIKYLYTNKIEFNPNDDLQILFTELQDVAEYYQLSNINLFKKQLNKLYSKYKLNELF